ncbi:hypothetical protein [Amycolatopsis pigmentata]|uniref:ABC-type transport system involved in multi-copper enzyme maturation, permease component n=1 Tax=Amycolatopsis pigmentata TaxID=450801 RepID=A0ABW5G7M0_9PSEU
MSAPMSALNPRILRIELRRSSASAVGGLVALLGVAGLYLLFTTHQGDLWDTQWTLLVTFERIMLVLLWPLSLGAGAWQARRDRRSRMVELLATTPRPVPLRVLSSAAAMAICVVLGYLLILAAGAVRVAGNTAYQQLDWLPIAGVGALSLVAASWLGMGIGRLLPSGYTPPLLVVAGFLVLMAPIQFGKTGSPGALGLLVPNLSKKLDEYSTISGSVSLAQAVWFGALAVSGLLLFMLTRRGALVAVVPAVAGLVAASTMLSGAPADGIVADPGAAAEVCTTDGGPAVCMTSVHAQGLSRMTGPARRALKLLAVLPDAPTSVHEVTSYRAGAQPAGEIWVHSDNFAVSQGESDDQVVVRMLAGAGTRLCDRPDGTGIADDYRVRRLAAAWLYGAYPAPGQSGPGNARVSPEEADAWRQLKALPEPEQVRRIAAVRRAGFTCQGDLRAALAGGAS